MIDLPPIPAEALAAARDAAKAQLRDGSGAEDALIETHAAAALALAEAFTGSVLIGRAATQTLPADRRWQMLDAMPVRSITGVAGIDGAGASVSLPVDTHAIDIDATGAGWVRAGAPGVAQVRVTYDAGLAADWDSLPPAVAQGVVLLIAHLFGARGDAGAPPAAVAALWRPWRRMRLRCDERAA